MTRLLAVVLGLAGSACLVQRPLPDLPEPTAAHETRRLQYPDGSPRSERRVLVWSDGRVERDGFEREFHRDGSLAAERFFERDRHVGAWRTWYPDGTPRSAVELGAAPAVQRFWHANGTLAAEGPLVDGKREGRWRYLDDAGRLEREGGYRAGLRDGPWRFRGPDGTVRAEGWYALGERVGAWHLGGEPGSALPDEPSDDGS